MSDVRSSEPVTKSGGLRLVPPALPPAPPAGGQRPPSPGSGSPGPGGSDSSDLAHLLTECLKDLSLIRTTLETLEVLSGFQDVEPEGELRPVIQDARLRLIQRLQEIDCRVTDGASSFSDRELQGFHRAMIDVLRRGVPYSLLDPWVGAREPFIGGGYGNAYRYPLPMRHLHDDPCNYSPSTLLRRLLEDLIEELSTDANLVSEGQFSQAVYRKCVGVLFACLVGAAPALIDDD